MIFVTADSCRAQLERLTKILVSAFPGSTIYQHTNLLCVPHDVLSHKVDAVLLGVTPEGKGALDLARKLHRQKPDTPVFITSKTEEFREEAEQAGANGYFVLPDSEPHFLEVMRSLIHKEHAL